MSRFIRIYRAVATLEAITWAGLIVGMIFKYLINGEQIGVRIFGSLHGAAFLTYSAMTLFAAVRFRWGAGVAALGIAAAFPPFCTVIFDRWAERTGRLAEPAVAEPARSAPQG